MKHTHLIVALGMFVAMTAAACGEQTPLGSALVGGGAGTTGAAGAFTVAPTGAGGMSTAPAAGAPACGPTGDRYRPTSIAAFKAAVHGTWTLCSPIGLFQRPQDGLFIGDDDRYVFLTLVNGKLVPQTGLENKGHVEYIDTSSATAPNSFQTNFVSDRGGTIVSHPVLSDVPRLLLINNNGVEEYTYGRVGPSGPNDVGPGASGPAPEDIRQPAAEVPCAAGVPFKPTGIEGIQGALRGTWVLCSPLGLFHRPQAGLYIGPDDRWVFLGRENGKLVALPGLDSKGRLEYVGGYAVYFTNDSGGTIIAAPPTFSDVPRLLSINNIGIEEYTYGLVQ